MSADNFPYQKSELKKPGVVRMTAACALSIVLIVSLVDSAPIDRQAVVTRHSMTVTSGSQLQVGNGEFAFTADITGLQTFENLCTMAHWAWHSAPLPSGQTVNDFQWTPHASYSGRMIPYPLDNGSAIAKWMQTDPHAWNLGRLGLVITKASGAAVALSDVQNPTQTLDFWNGVLRSQFTIEGQTVQVITCVNPVTDAVALRIISPLISAGRLKVSLAFPYPNSDGFGDVNNPNAHASTMVLRNSQRADIHRTADLDSCDVSLTWAGSGTLTSPSRHNFLLSPAAAAQFEVSCAFAPQKLPDSLPSVTGSIAACAQYWPDFWKSGACIDLSGSTDTRWMELERRIVYSQYIIAVNEAGSYPPSEYGLKPDPWHSRFHFEMIWWHGMHYTLWDRWPFLNRFIGIYQKYLPGAEAIAAKEGYKGARWFKCTGNTQVEWPCTWHAWLIWQNPHPIYFAEMDYRARPTAATLARWRDVVIKTGDFLATIPSQDRNDPNRLVLGNPIMVVGETGNVDSIVNPAFELSYWRFGLRTAQDWRIRLGLPRDTLYDRVLRTLAWMPVQDSAYLQWETIKNQWTSMNYEHPAFLGTYGMLPGDGVDTSTMHQTLNKVRASNWNMPWGWDFGMSAMCAARLNLRSIAVDYLMRVPMDNYLPGEGSLLSAVAMMCTGWGSGPQENAPGFPNDGSWNVKWEGFKLPLGLVPFGDRRDVNLAQGRIATASYSVETGPWSISKATNGITEAYDIGWSSNGYQDNANHTEWVKVDLGSSTAINQVVLYPRADDPGLSFPVDFTIDVSIDNTTWTTVVTKTGYADPGATPQTFNFTGATARYVRVNATKLGWNNGWYQFQLNEIKVYNASITRVAPQSSVTPNHAAITVKNDRGNVSFRLDLPRGRVAQELRIYNCAGRCVWAQAMTNKSNSVRWDRTAASSHGFAGSGIYIVQVKTDRFNYYDRFVLK